MNSTMIKMEHIVTSSAEHTSRHFWVYCVMLEKLLWKTWITSETESRYIRK